MTLRACLIGAILTMLFAILVPWNDYQLENTMLYNNHLPPLVTLVLLGLGLLVNPWLGRWRLAPGEMVLIAVMLLGLGGVASSGLMRYLPTYMSNSAEVVGTRPNLDILQLPLPDDGDAQTEDWQWTAHPELYVGMPQRGPVQRTDAEHQYVVGGYLYGHGAEADRLRVDHRRTVTWRIQPGDQQFGPLLALRGEVAAEYRNAGQPFLDLDDRSPLVSLRGLRPGDSVLLASASAHQVADGEDFSALAQRYYGDATAAPDLARFNQAQLGDALRVGSTIQIPQRATVTAIEFPAVPWYAWAPPFLMWLPLLIAAFAAMIAIAGIVRKQWMENERLPYPIAAATMSLMESPEPGKRLAKIFTNKAFWSGFAVVVIIVLWNGLYTYKLVPIGMTTELPLRGVFSGQPWDLVYDQSTIFMLRIYFSIVAMCFFLNLELSFSLWVFFIVMQLGTMLLRSSGVPVEKEYVAAASGGGFITMVVLIAWVGRHYYWRLLRSAFLFRRDEETAEAVPYVWVLLVSVAVLMGFMISMGIPWDGALLAVLLMLGMLLVLSRFVAEAGIPYIQPPLGAGYSMMAMNLIGYSLPPQALIPLALIGSTVMADPRESLMPYAVNAGFLGKRVGIAGRQVNLVMLLAVVGGTVLAFAAMVYFAYQGSGAVADPWAPRATAATGWSDPASMLEQRSTAEGLAIAEQTHGHTLTSMGAGAGIVALLGAARMYMTAWPLHPIGFLTMASFPTGKIWFSFFIGWLLKACVMRFGGTGVYTKLKPVAIGFIAGEAVGMGAFLIIKMVAEVMFDMNLPSYRVLPS